MAELSYSNLKAEILDDFYIEMINHAHKSEASYEEIIMGYLSYDYEEGFSSIENIIIEFVLYVMGGRYFVSEDVYKKLRTKLQGYIENKEILSLLRNISDEEKEYFLHDLYLVGIIDKKKQQEIYQEI